LSFKSVRLDESTFIKSAVLPHWLGTNRLRVLHFFKTSIADGAGGTEHVTDTLARGTGLLGIDVDVLALSRNPVPATTDMGGYRLHRSQLSLEVASTGMSLSVIPRFAEMARRADLVHYHFPWPFMDLVHFMARVKKPSVVTYHSDIVRQRGLLRLYRPLMNRFLADVTHIVATSPNYLQTSEVLAELGHKTSVIPIGVDRAAYLTPGAGSGNYWRQRFGSRFFLFIGVLRYYKGLHILLQAAQGTQFPVVIVGAGPTEIELKAQAVQLGLSNVHFLGHVSEADKAALLDACYGVVFPSHLRSEAFGVSLLEGAMYGKPMISSEIGTGTTFVNIAGVTGLVVPPSAPIALQQAMRRLWESPEEAAAMGRCAEERYWAHFTAEKMVKSYVDLYKTLCINP
jgi:glycosyltransferase involved in cell wall biosynthesis